MTSLCPLLRSSREVFSASLPSVMGPFSFVGSPGETGITFDLTSSESFPSPCVYLGR